MVYGTVAKGRGKVALQLRTDSGHRGMHLLKGGGAVVLLCCVPLEDEGREARTGS